MELLQVAEAVAREKSIERDEVLLAMEQAIQKAGRSKYGQEHDIRAHIDRRTGDIRLMRYRLVADPVEDEATQMTLEAARRKSPDAKVGDFLTDDLPPIDFGRIAAQTAKQVIVQKVREAERKRQYEEYQDRVGEIVNGLVKRVEYGNVTVDLGRAEGILRRDELLPREHFKVGDRVRSYIYDVRQEPRGPQIFLSRSHPQFMAKLFGMEVPEIYDGIIEIKSVARDPGSRAKIAVMSHDSSIDPVGACVGMRGSRVQAVVGELQGEKIDIIPWSSEPATFIVNALAPAEVSKVVLDDDQRRIEVVVPDEQLSLAIGRRGQNVRLASMLTGWEIDILTEAEESERRTEEFKQRSQLFMQALDVDDVIAHLLVAEGFTRLEEIAYVPTEEIADIEGFDETIAGELQARARTWLEEQNRQNVERYRELGVSDDLAAISPLTAAMLVALGTKGILTLDDLGDLASDELIEIVGDGALDEDAANAVIMAARAHWFEGEAAAGDAAAPGPDGKVAGMSAVAEAGTLERDDAPERGPMRRCIASGQSRPKEALLRFVVGPQGELVPDLEGRLPGRGLWVASDRQSVARAVAKRLFSRAARQPVAVPEDLERIVEAGLVRRTLELIALARRAGQAVAGFEKVRGWLRDGTATALIEASDGGESGRAKLRGLAGTLPVVDVLTAAELGGAFGRDIAVHAALARGGLAPRILLEAGRLAGWRRAGCLLDEKAGGAEDAAASKC